MRASKKACKHPPKSLTRIISRSGEAVGIFFGKCWKVEFMDWPKPNGIPDKT